MSTAPFAPDTPALLTGNLTHLARARVHTPAGDEVELLLVDGYLDYDESRAPRVEAQLDVHLPTDSAFLARVDPRTGARVTLELGYVRPDTQAEDVHQLCDLGLRRATPDYVTDELSLKASSDEALVIDNAASAVLSISQATTTAAIVEVIEKCLTPTVTVTATNLGSAVTSSTPDGDKWTTIDDLADQIIADVYDDGTREWFITDRPNTLGTPALSLTHGEAGTLVRATTETSREDAWANRVFLVHEWRDAGGANQRVVAVADAAGPYAPAFGNVRTLTVRRDVPTTQLQADASAVTLVARAVTKGRSFRVTAPSAYWLRPGHTLELTLPRTDPELHLIASVRFNIRTGLMDLTTRLPE